MEPNIKQIIDEYLQSTKVTHEETIDKISQQNNLNAIVRKNKDEFFKNFAKLLLNEIEKTNLSEILKINKSDALLFKNCDWYKKFIKDVNILRYVKNEWKQLADTGIIVETEILKTNFVENAMSGVINLFLKKVNPEIKKEKLKLKLNEKKLFFDPNLEICKLFVSGKVNDLDKVADIVDEINFYQQYTNYNNIYSEKICKYYEQFYNYNSYGGDNGDGDSYDTYYSYDSYNNNDYTPKSVSEVEEITKEIILKYISPELLKIAPKNVIELYNKIKCDKPGDDVDEKPKKIKK
jgi:hypothetical protein